MTTTITAPIAPHGELLATDASTSTDSTAKCDYCRRTVLRGERYALLVPSGRVAHVHCIGAAFAGRRRGVPVIP